MRHALTLRLSGRGCHRPPASLVPLYGTRRYLILHVTEGVTLRYTELVAEYGQLASELQAFIDNDIARINQAMSSAPYIMVGSVIR